MNIIIPTAEEIKEAIFAMDKHIGANYCSIKLEVSRHHHARTEKYPETHYPFEVEWTCYHHLTGHSEKFPTLAGALQQMLHRGSKHTLKEKAAKLRAEAEMLERALGGAS